MIRILAILVGLAIYGFVVQDIRGRVDDAAYEALKLKYTEAEVAALKAGAAEAERLERQRTEAAERQVAAQQRIAEQIARRLREAQRHVKELSVCLPWGFVRLHDAGALGVDYDSLPLPAGKSDDSCAPAQWADLYRTLTANYGACQANARQLEDLIEFNRRVKAPPAGPRPSAAGAPAARGRDR